MKAFLLLVSLTALFVTPAFADVYVHSYTKQDGTIVPEHYRSAPDNNPHNNWSVKGNINPHTGQEGVQNPQYNNTFQNRR